MMKNLYSLLLMLSALMGCNQPEKQTLQTEHGGIEEDLTASLGIPYGTICKLKAEFLHGDSIRTKETSGRYFLKILFVNGKQVENVILPFSDETGKLTDSAIAAGIKQANLVGYETGQFSGIPKGNAKYQPIKAGKAFHFERSIIIIDFKE